MSKKQSGGAWKNDSDRYDSHIHDSQQPEKHSRIAPRTGNDEAYAVNLTEPVPQKEDKGKVETPEQSRKT